ncbi:MAG: hypothetical protein QOI12_1029 [Alphaproteobacteria bacterium]|jgi:hypothetical protein|nr:hypothetical protein [Alphaproteobacteria bacterium]
MEHSHPVEKEVSETMWLWFGAILLVMVIVALGLVGSNPSVTTSGYAPIVDEFRLVPPITQPAPAPLSTTGQGSSREDL